MPTDYQKQLFIKNLHDLVKQYELAIKITKVIAIHIENDNYHEGAQLLHHLRALWVGFYRKTYQEFIKEFPELAEDFKVGHHEFMSNN